MYQKKTMFAFLGALMCVVLLASTDEIHQLFTDGRTAMVQDVLLDSFGGLLGILYFMFLDSRWRKRD